MFLNLFHALQFVEVSDFIAMSNSYPLFFVILILPSSGTSAIQRGVGVTKQF